MTVSITGKINKTPNEFPAGDSVGFGLRLGERYYDRETKQKEWTNYEFVLFAKAQSQIDFYRDALREGAIIEVSGSQQKIKSFTPNTGGDPHLSIEIQDAKLGFIWGGEASGNGQPQQAPQQRSAPQSPAPAPQQPSEPGYIMTSAADGFTREQYLGMGWTDQQLLDKGFMEIEPPF